ncbi:uncharacterized protein LOC129603239 isoform X2 [Betta splendens]|uniref:Uncharacterized protein LOC129603239 isoform X2 n=1 Tax=Betta splendens TaxID=158456 RepID=A0A9W2XC69_BETSP|nr:uncharacterized protein LOC129603239 isoform X2 [Betta splendens]
MASWSGSIVRPYIYDPESDPDAQEEAVEVTTFRMIQDVSQWYQCGKCQSMPTEAENCCCQEIAQTLQVSVIQKFCELVLGISGTKSQSSHPLMRGVAHQSRVP